MSVLGSRPSALGSRLVLRRQRALLDFALAALVRRPGKAIVLGTVLVLIVFVLTSLAFLQASVRLEAVAMLRGAPDLLVQQMVAGRQEVMPADAVASLKAVPGVVRVEGRRWGYYFDPSAGANYTVVAPFEAPPRPGEAAVGSGIARSRAGYSREVLALRSYAGAPVVLRVVATLPEPSDLLGADLLLVSGGDFRALFALEGDAVNDVAVWLAPGADVAAATTEVRRRVPGARVVARAAMAVVAESWLDVRGGLLAVVVLALVLALIIVAADKPAAVSVDEQREIGILRALGWSATDVLVAKAWEPLAVSLVALLAGTLAAYAHVYPLGAMLFAPLLRGWGVLAPTLHLVPAVDVRLLGAIAAMTLLLPAGGTVLACHRASRDEPDAVVRG